MPDLGMIKAVLREYGLGWAVNRALYSLKLRTMRAVPGTEKWYEKKSPYPTRLDLFTIDTQELKRFLSERSGSEKTALLSAADQACKGVITGFSSIEMDYGDPIDWQLNPLTGKRCDASLKWYRIPDFDPERGDIKAVWEISRFSCFLTLARAYLLSGDPKYYRAFSAELADWLEKNPYGYGANFKCGQECSLRMVNALLAYTVFRNEGIASDADGSRMKDLIDRCYRKVLSNFFYAYKCIKNNHTISELMGMIIGAWCTEDEKRLEKAYRLLDEVVESQFTRDGGYRQFSFTYERLALEDVEVILAISGKTGRSLGKKVFRKIKNAAMLLYQCQDESGDVPNYGSNDGALAFPVTCSPYRDFRPVINTVYALTEGETLYGHGSFEEELLWFSGGRKLDEFEPTEEERVSSRFPNAGLYTIRDGNTFAMIVSNEFTSRPAHMDQLHFDLFSDGVNVFCDAGTYSYASETGRKLAGNESHNTASVDGVLQMSAKGPFLLYNWPERKPVKTDDVGFSGGMVSKNGYTHLRDVKKTDAVFEIRDRVDRDFIVRFHTPCSVRKEENGVVLSYGGKDLCTVRSSGVIDLSEAERSIYYLRLEKINCLSIRGSSGSEVITTIEICEEES